MAQAIVLYLAGLTIRSVIVALVAGLCTWRMRSVTRRHAVWAAVLGIMILLPLADRFVPPINLPTSVRIVAPAERYLSPFDPNASMPTQSVPSIVERDVQQRSSLPGVWTIVAIGFGLVTVVFAVQIVFAHGQLQKIRRRSRLISTPAFKVQTCGLRESDEVALPITIGWLKPVIILPSNWTTWDAWTLRAVLSHELAHVRRRDWAIAMIAAINTVVFWYNPLSWWLERRLTNLCEEACDEASVSAVGDAARYSQVLLQFAAAHVGSRLRAGGVAMARRNIVSRIERILATERPESGVLTRMTFITVFALAVPALYISAAAHSGTLTPVRQIGAPILSFEVASVKPSALGGGYSLGDCQGVDSKIGRFSPGLGRCVYRNIELKGLISQAYSPVSFGGRLGFPWNQIEQSDGLNWISSQRFDIEAKAENASTTTEQQLYQMLQQLLADRFQLKLHREPRETAGYVLQVAASGAKLSQATGREARPGMGGGPPSGGFMAGEAVPVSAIVTFLSMRLSRPIEDRTGLMGLYNWELKWAPDESEVRPDGVPVKSDPANPGPSFLTAVQEQLGLRLQPAKLNIEILHIDQAEKPRPNEDVLAVRPALTQRPSFEVASLKPYADSAGPVFYGYRLAPGSPRMTFSGVTVKMLLKYAYRINDFQIIGGPDWIHSERYDIEAKAEEGSVTRKDFSDPMVLPEPFAVRIQSLLDERFHLTMHRETRGLQVYELLIAGGGSRMTLSTDQSPLSLPEPGDPGKPPVPPQQAGLFRGAIGVRRALAGFTLEGSGVPMSRFINLLSMQLGRPILDRANLGPGLYDINLRWSSDGGTPENADAPSIFTALREQLGLRLATGKGPVEVFVIESVEKPTPN